VASDDIEVLIIGGSLVGLTTAMLLGHYGVPSLSVERHAGTAIHPRAGHFQLGTMEMLRQVGLEDEVRAASLETYHPTAESSRSSRLPGGRSPPTSESSTRASRGSARPSGCS
jgi:2-polyprenyl-6-methoxyphenol hydroxylase-like FAD-dependent oxidoreductase